MGRFLLWLFEAILKETYFLLQDCTRMASGEPGKATLSLRIHIVKSNNVKMMQVSEAVVV